MALALLGWALTGATPARAQDHAEAPADAHGDAAHEDAAHGEHDAAHGEHDGAHAPVNTNPVEADPDLAIYTLIVFVILFFILTKFAWKPIAEALDRREHLIAEQIAAAERSQTEARQLLHNYEQKLAAAQDEVRGILDEARRDAAATGQEIVAKAASEAEAEKNRALREIDTAKVQAVKELAEQSARLAVSLAGKIVSSELDQNRHSQLIHDAMARFPAGNGERN
ncbi:MAG: F0F1 ATP synthase subunit B [Pirellulales bacterium]|nr:F0F1 ATP synthase subunit B [Pirellulales bacterium]